MHSYLDWNIFCNLDEFHVIVPKTSTTPNLKRESTIFYRYLVSNQSKWNRVRNYVCSTRKGREKVGDVERGGKGSWGWREGNTQGRCLIYRITCWRIIKLYHLKVSNYLSLLKPFDKIKQVRKKHVFWCLVKRVNLRKATRGNIRAWPNNITSDNPLTCFRANHQSNHVCQCWKV